MAGMDQAVSGVPVYNQTVSQERALAIAEGVRFKLKILPDSQRGTRKLKVKDIGRVILTTDRLIFEPEKQGSSAGGQNTEFWFKRKGHLALSLRGVASERYRQPLFGANFLEGKFAPPLYGDGLLDTHDSVQTDSMEWTVVFKSGGSGLFLKEFFRVMGYCQRPMGGVVPQRAFACAADDPAQARVTAAISPDEQR